MQFYALVEGHGEVKAVPVLLARLGHHLGMHIPWTGTLRWKNIHLWKPGHGGVAACCKDWSSCEASATWVAFWFCATKTISVPG